MKAGGIAVPKPKCEHLTPDVGLIDGSWLPEQAERLQQLIDDPDGRHAEACPA